VITVRRRVALQLRAGERVYSVKWVPGNSVRQYAPDDFGGAYGCVKNGDSIQGSALDEISPSDGDELIFYREQHYELVAVITWIGWFFATYGVQIAISVALAVVSFVVQLLLAPGGGGKRSASQIFTGLSNRTRRGDTVPVLIGTRRLAPKLISFFTEVREDGTNIYRGLYAISVGRIKGFGGATAAFDRRTRDAKRVEIGAVTGGSFEVNSRFLASPSGASGRLVAPCRDGDTHLYYVPYEGEVLSGDVITLALLPPTTTTTSAAEDDPTLDVLKINGNPLSSYKGATVSFRPGEMTQAVIPGWNQVHTVVPVQVTLDQPMDADGRPEAGTSAVGEPFLYETTQPVDWVVVNFTHPSLFKSGASGQHAYRVYYHLKFRAADDGGSPGPWHYVVWNRTLGDYDVTLTESERRPFMVEALRVSPFVSAFKLEFFDEDRVPFARQEMHIEVQRYNGNVTDLEDTDLVEDKIGVHQPPNRNSQITLESVDEIVDYGLSHPGLALLDISVVATEQLNSEPLISGTFDGIYCPVWDGVDPESPVFAWKWTNNPAWVALAVLLHEGFGLGGKIEVPDIDLPSFKAVADFCDQMVDDGEGGTEKFAMYDDVLEEAIGWWDMLQRIGTSARFQPIQVGSKIRLRLEAPRERVQVFGMGNIIAGSFKRTFVNPAKAPSQVVLTIRNKDLDDDPDKAIDEDDTVDGPFRTAPAEELHGVRRMGQGRREAKARRLLGQGITELIEFQAFIDAMGMEAGDRFGLNHDSALWNRSGLLAAGCTLTTVILDSEVILEDGTTYECLVRHPNDMQETRQITSPAGTYAAGDAITVGTGWSLVPARHCVWAIGPENAVVRDWNCAKIEFSPDGKVTITAPNYFESWMTDSLVLSSSGVQAPFPTRNTPDTLPVDISNLRLQTHQAVLPDGSIREGIRASWVPPDAAASVSAEVFYRRKGMQAWVSAGRTRSRDHLILGDLEVGLTYQVAVCGVSSSGQTRQHPDDAPVVELLYAPAPALPVAPIGAALSRSGNLLTISWAPPGVDVEGQSRNRQVAQYEVRRGDDWRTAYPLLSVKGFSAELRDWIPGRETFLIKAVDSHQQSSPSGVAIATNQPAPVGQSVVLNRNERTLGWPEIAVQCAVNSRGRMELDTGERVGFYVIDSIDLGREAAWHIGVVAHIRQEPLHWTGEASRATIAAVTGGPFTRYEIVTGSVSGATARVIRDCADGDLYVYLKPETGTLAADDVLTGGTSGATATMKAGPWVLCGDDAVWDERDFGGFADEDVMTDSVTGHRSGVSVRVTKEDGSSSLLTGGQGTVTGRYLQVELTLASDDPDNFTAICSEMRIVATEPVSRVEGLFTGETNPARTLRPDGAGGVVWV